jgi:hypothetical protein
MKQVRRTGAIAALGAAVAASVSCGDVVRQGRSPVFVVLDSLQGSRGGTTAGPLGGTLQSDVVTLLRTPPPCTPETPCPTIFSDNGSATFHLAQKDISATAPTTNNAVTITRYRVSFRRADGRNIPGVDVPYGFDGAATATIPPTGNATLSFELVRHVMKQESPLVQLGNTPVIISTIADVTFYGQDQVGNEVTVSGSISVDFGNFGDR